MSVIATQPRPADVAVGSDLLDQSEELREATIARMGLDALQAEATKGRTDLHHETFPALDESDNARGQYTGYVGLTSARNPQTGRLRNQGVHKGGLRFDRHVTGAEIRWLSGGMLDKVDLFGLPLEGGKGGVIVDAADETSPRDIARGFAHTFSHILGQSYVGATDIGTSPELMSIIASVAGGRSVTGKPLARGGLDGHALCTGFGLATATELVAKYYDAPLQYGSTVAIHGFGKVGMVVAKFLADNGCKVVAVADQHCGIVAEGGFNIQELTKHAKTTGSVMGFASDGEVTSETVLYQPVDVLELASTEAVITRHNAGLVSAKIIGGGANGGITLEGQRHIRGHYTGHLWASGAGVYGSYLEMQKNAGTFTGDRAEVLCRVRREFTRSFTQIVDAMKRYNTQSVTEAAQCVIFANRLASLGIPLEV